MLNDLKSPQIKPVMFSESVPWLTNTSVLNYVCFRPVIIQDIVPYWEAYKKWSKQFFLDNYRTHRVMLKAVDVCTCSRNIACKTILDNNISE